MNCGTESLTSESTTEVMPCTVVMSSPYTGAFEAMFHSVPCAISFAAAVSVFAWLICWLTVSRLSRLPRSVTPPSSCIACSSCALTCLASEYSFKPKNPLTPSSTTSSARINTTHGQMRCLLRGILAA